MSDLLINILFLKVFVSSFHSGLRYACFKKQSFAKANSLIFKTSQASNSNIMNQTHDIMDRHYLANSKFLNYLIYDWFDSQKFDHLSLKNTIQ